MILKTLGYLFVLLLTTGLLTIFIVLLGSGLKSLLKNDD
jgi:hypothetical protein